MDPRRVRYGGGVGRHRVGDLRGGEPNEGTAAGQAADLEVARHTRGGNGRDGGIGHRSGLLGRGRVVRLDRLSKSRNPIPTLGNGSAGTGLPALMRQTAETFQETSSCAKPFCSTPCWTSSFPA